MSPRRTSRQAQHQPQLRIGCSGYQYDHWRGVFYPQALPKRLWFDHYAQHFDTVEVNNTFYHLPSEAAFDHWRDEAPNGFLYALKFSRYGTHRKKLKDPDNTVPHFTTLADRLGDLLGPILVQLPPRWKVNVERLDAFFAVAPRRYRWAVEIRDPSWLNDEVFAVLRAHNAALCIHDMIPNHPREITADWVYLRYHGGGTHEGKYETAEMEREGSYIRGLLKSGLDLYAYFNNDVAGHAVHNALQLRAMVTGSDKAIFNEIRTHGEEHAAHRSEHPARLPPARQDRSLGSGHSGARPRRHNGRARQPPPHQ